MEIEDKKFYLTQPSNALTPDIIQKIFSQCHNSDIMKSKDKFIHNSLNLNNTFICYLQNKDEKQMEFNDFAYKNRLKAYFREKYQNTIENEYNKKQLISYINEYNSFKEKIDSILSTKEEKDENIKDIDDYKLYISKHPDLKFVLPNYKTTNLEKIIEQYNMNNNKIYSNRMIDNRNLKIQNQIHGFLNNIQNNNNEEDFPIFSINDDSSHDDHNDDGDDDNEDGDDDFNEDEHLF